MLYFVANGDVDNTKKMLISVAEISKLYGVEVRKIQTQSKIDWSMTLLHIAVFNSHTETLRALIELEPNVTVTDNIGRAPLHKEYSN